MPASDLLALRDRLEAAVRDAGNLARETASRPFKQWTKDDRSPVTEADLAVNELLRERLTALTPGVAWQSEESQAEPADRVLPQAWIVDPIDGTRAFMEGRADWTISVAFAEHGRPAVAAVYAPVTDEMFLATRGLGTTLNGARIGTTRGDGLDGAKLAGPKRYLDRFAGLAAGVLAEPRVHSLALRLARVAHGALDAAFAGPGTHDWDLAAADLLVHEAGGVVTDFAGQPLIYNGKQDAHVALVAAGQARHDALINLVRDRKIEFA